MAGEPAGRVCMSSAGGEGSSARGARAGARGKRVIYPVQRCAILNSRKHAHVVSNEDPYLNRRSCRETEIEAGGQSAGLHGARPLRSARARSSLHSNLHVTLPRAAPAHDASITRTPTGQRLHRPFRTGRSAGFIPGRGDIPRRPPLGPSAVDWPAHPYLGTRRQPVLRALRQCAGTDA